MRSIDVKLLRDLWNLRSQVLAISMVMACGVATYVMSLSTSDSLERNRAAYYDRYRFAHVFAHLKRAPMQLRDRVAEIPGVAVVQARVVVDVTLDIKDLPEPAVGRLISIPPRNTPTLNELHLRAGRYVEPGRRGEVLASEAFVEEHKLQPGDSILAVLNGRRQRLHIVGVVLSPEYVYAIRPGELLPDNKRFGVFWMNYDELASAFDLDGAFNDVSLTLMRGASEPEVIRRLDRLTEPYGGIGAYGRADQQSDKMIEGELTQLRGMALITPTIFLAVAAFLLNVVLGRLIGLQREQIAVLKAFGYSRWEIGLHYLKFVGLLVVLGGILGTIAGAFLGNDLAHLYAQFFRLPTVVYRLDVRVIVTAMALCGGASVIGALGAVRRAVNLPAAEAMRPEAPQRYTRTLLERIGLQQILTPTSRMILRRLSREPVHSALSVIGIALSVAVLVLGSFVIDTVYYVMDFQFSLSQRQDISVSFVEPTSTRVLSELQHLPGVQYAEPFRSVAVRVRYGPRSRRLGIMGLEKEAKLFRLLDEEGKQVILPSAGLAVSEKLAEVLGARVGDEVIVEVLEGKRPTRTVPIAAVIHDFTAPAAYMEWHALCRFLEEGPSCSGAFVAAEEQQLDTLYARLKQMPRVGGVTVKTAALRSFEETLAENLLRMRATNVIFACIIAFGVVYNSARITLSERSRELATMRVMGFTRAEVSGVLLGELAVITVAALPVGLLLGYGLSYLVVMALETENQRFPLVILPATYAFAASVTVVAAIISALIVRRRIDRLDLLAVLKASE